MEESTLSTKVDKSSAVSFSVEFDDQAKKPRRKPPKNLSANHHHKKEVSQASLDKKLKLADERRKKHIEERLERVRQLEEEAMKFARAMDPIIQASTQAKKDRQSESFNGFHRPSSIRPRCAETDLVKAARDIIAGSTDMISSEIESLEDTKSDPTDNSAAVSFSVDFDEKPKRKPPKNLSANRYRKKEVSQATLDEKFKQADERRKKHIEDRVERVRQLEEEAMKFARAMEPLMQASTQARKDQEPESVNGLHKPSSIRPRCAETDLVKAARDMVIASTDHVRSESELLQNGKSHQN